jgi:stress response protein YsnF
VLKEEIWLRKRVVEEDEVIEVDLRKEEVEIDDQTKPGAEEEV